MSLVLINQTDLVHHGQLCFAGAACDLCTNSYDLLQLLTDISAPLRDMAASRFSARILVEQNSFEGLRAPHFRGQHHIVTASFGGKNLFVFDLSRRTLSAHVSITVACDKTFWKEKLIPIALGVLGAAMGLVPMHCACLELDGDGLLIAGMSGAGKSTLSVSLSQSGFNYISDDWTYISQRESKIVAYGTSAPVKLLPDAVEHFQVLDSYEVHTSMNGELAYEVDVRETFGANVVRFCEPRWLIFLERRQQPGSKFTRLSPSEAERYLVSSLEMLPAQLEEAVQRRKQTIDLISHLPCWSFQYGGTPQFASSELLDFVATSKEGVLV